MMAINQLVTLDSLLFMILLAFFLNTLLNLKRISPVATLPPGKDWPFVSILVPARNEEKKIRPLIESLLQQDYDNFEIVVLDDNSSDCTWPILQELSAHNPRLRIKRSQELPPGWTGKNWACHQLSSLAQGEIFLYTDADTIHNPLALKQAVASAIQHQSGLLSALPTLEAKTWSEKLYMPLIPFAFLTLVPFFKINSRRHRSFPAVLGPFLLLPRKTYEATGGHAAVKENIVDDIALARQVNKQGGKITLIDGSRLLSIRFYTCFKELWDGFSKNSYEAIKGTPLKLLGVILLGYFLFIRPYLALLDSLSQSHPLSPPLLQVALISLIRIILAERFGTGLLWVMLHPLSIALALLILINSFRLALFQKKIAWKERWYVLPK